MLWFLFACARSPIPTEATTLASTTTGESTTRRGLSQELMLDGPLESRLSVRDGADLVIVYGGEERGSLEDCGCPQRPRGGLARHLSYLDAVREAGDPVLFVNGGYWLEDATNLEGEPRADAPVLNRWMVAGMEQLQPQALNISYNDTAGLTSLGDLPIALPMVSANVAGSTVIPSVTVSVDGIQVGITGITTPGAGFLETPGFEIRDPVRAGREVLESLSTEVDFVVLLAYGDPKSGRKLAETGLVDVVIDTHRHRENYPPVFVGEALWVRSHYQTMRLGELRLGFDDGEISWAVERKIDMDKQIPDQPEEAIIQRAAAEEIKAVQMEAFGREL